MALVETGLVWLVLVLEPNAGEQSPVSFTLEGEAVQYLVLVKFNSEVEIPNPEAYIEGAVAEMRGCYAPGSVERSIYPDSVSTIDLMTLPANQTLGSVLKSILKQDYPTDAQVNQEETRLEAARLPLEEEDELDSRRT